VRGRHSSNQHVNRLKKSTGPRSNPRQHAQRLDGRLRLDRLDEVANARRDLGAETRAVEDAVVTDALLQVVDLAMRRDV